MSTIPSLPTARPVDAETLACLRTLERRVLWLSTWMIHHANHLRPSRDGLKVGGHQASSASVATLMTALYFHVLRPEDRVAVNIADVRGHGMEYLVRDQEVLFNLAGQVSHIDSMVDPVTDLEIQLPTANDSLTTVLALDVSGSMAENGKIDQAKQAARLFRQLGALRDYVRACGLEPDGDAVPL